jgi:hypothetical protein
MPTLNPFTDTEAATRIRASICSKNQVKIVEEISWGQVDTNIQTYEFTDRDILQAVEFINITEYAFIHLVSIPKNSFTIDNSLLYIVAPEDNSVPIGSFVPMYSIDHNF